MTCSEYVVLGCHTDTCLVMAACDKHLRKHGYLRMEDNPLEIAVNTNFSMSPVVLRKKL